MVSKTERATIRVAFSFAVCTSRTEATLHFLPAQTRGGLVNTIDFGKNVFQTIVSMF